MVSLRSCRLFSTSSKLSNGIVMSATTVTSSTTTFDEQIPRPNRFSNKQNNINHRTNNRSTFQITENLTMPELNRIRTIPTLITFYGGNPIHENNMNQLKYLLRKYENLPTKVLSDEELSTQKFIGFDTYKEKTQSGTRVKKIHYRDLITSLNRLRVIDPELMPVEVIDVLNNYYSKSANKSSLQTKLKTLDEFGRAKAKAKRKASKAHIYLVRGEGEIIVNGKNVVEYFTNIYARKNLNYPFQVIDQEGKYNVFAEVNGGGYTGQSEAIMYAIAKALVIFNPLVKPRLSKAGLMTSDARVVERKKPGKVKARKSPTWVKR
ncbi:MRPS9 [Candida pseudojiufengensis]|uniref:MRPS9 n=1 Tax=Candida pseudojiufengensis TaxID=497109 RepID=UPI0022257D86|nr:MRPS9 [Candida pseudojiufengensis]KAI5961449.1 MRPS9 [Candida pseudojiufengensis]